MPNQAPSPWWPPDDATDVPLDAHIWVSGGSVEWMDNPSNPVDAPRFALESNDHPPIRMVYEGLGNQSSVTTYGYGTVVARLVPQASLEANTGYRVIYRKPGVSDEDYGTMILNFETGARTLPELDPPTVVGLEQELIEDPEPPNMSATTADHGTFRIELTLPDTGPYFVRARVGKDYAWRRLVGPGEAGFGVPLTYEDPPSCADIRVLNARADEIARLEDECAQPAAANAEGSSSGCFSCSVVTPSPRWPGSILVAALLLALFRRNHLASSEERV